MTTVLGRSLITSALLTAAALGGMACAAGGLAYAQAPAGGAAGADGITSRLELMLRTMRIARDYHVNKPAKPELVAGAIQGLLNRVDSEAEIYSRSELRRLGVGSEKRADGSLGLELRREAPIRRQPSRGYRVVSSRDGSPAARFGLQAGDLITHFDRLPAGDMRSLAVKYSQIGGAPGTRVRLTIERDGARDPFQVELERWAMVLPPAIVGEAGVGVITVRISAFEPNMAARIEGDISALRGQMGIRFRGIVVDLRDTAGGDLGAAEALADVFLDRGTLMVVEARSGRDSGHIAAPGDAGEGRALVVLVNGGTAGPAEVLAAALQDNKRARIVGGKTAGRGAVRTLRGLGKKGEKGALLLATSRLMTPSGRPIEGQGVTPDIAIEQTPADEACRPVDISDKRVPGRCVRRTPAEDGQLERGLGLLDEQIAAGGGSLVPRP